MEKVSNCDGENFREGSSRLTKINLPDVLDDDYSVDGYIENLRSKNLKSREKSSGGEEKDLRRGGCHTSFEVRSKSTQDTPLSAREMTYLELRDLMDRRLSDARFDVVENKIDRVITSLKKGESSGEEKHLLRVMLERIRDLEKKLDQKASRKDYVNLSFDPLADGYVHPYSTYVVEKATQTPSKDHTCEGVYVLVSKKNKQRVQQVHRNLTYALDDEIATYPQSRGAYYYVGSKSKSKKVIRRFGYPEYVFDASYGSHPIWDRGIRKSIAFLPPIPDPYAKRRPRFY